MKNSNAIAHLMLVGFFRVRSRVAMLVGFMCDRALNACWLRGAMAHSMLVGFWRAIALWDDAKYRIYAHDADAQKLILSNRYNGFSCR